MRRYTYWMWLNSNVFDDVYFRSLPDGTLEVFLFDKHDKGTWNESIFGTLDNALKASRSHGARFVPLLGVK